MYDKKPGAPMPMKPAKGGKAPMGGKKGKKGHGGGKGKRAC